MTPQEQQMLDGLISRVQSTQLAGKDNEAQARIQNALAGNPDALYILCQTVLVQGYALEQATAQLQAAQQQLAQAQQNAGNHPGFLEKIFGSSQPAPAIPRATPAYGAPVYAAPAYPPQGMPPQGYPAPGYGAQPGGGFGGGFGGGGFLQGALQTAAGVAMGEIAVQSIEGLVHGFGREAGYSSDRALGGFDNDSGRSFGDTGNSDSFGDRLQAADNAGPGLSNDIEDRRGDSQGFFGSDSNSGSGLADTDTGGYDADSNSADDSGSSGSDFSGSDDSGSSDSGSDDFSGGGNDSY